MFRSTFLRRLIFFFSIHLPQETSGFLHLLFIPLCTFINDNIGKYRDSWNLVTATLHCGAFVMCISRCRGASLRVIFPRNETSKKKREDVGLFCVQVSSIPRRYFASLSLACRRCNLEKTLVTPLPLMTRKENGVTLSYEATRLPPFYFLLVVNGEYIQVLFYTCRMAREDTDPIKKLLCHWRPRV